MMRPPWCNVSIQKDPCRITEREWAARRSTRTVAKSCLHKLYVMLYCSTSAQHSVLRRGLQARCRFVSLRYGSPSVMRQDERGFNHRVRHSEGMCPQTLLFADISAYNIKSCQSL